MNNQKELKNGTDLLTSLDVTLSIMDEYQLKGNAKRKANLFRQEVEKVVNPAIDEMHERDEEFLQNALNKKERMIKQIASLHEADQILLSEFVNKFINNIDIARKKGVVFFEKMI